MTEQNPEELFPPRVGGMVHTARQKKIADQQQLDALDQAAEAVPRFKPVSVQQRTPDLSSAKTIVIATGDANGGIWRLAGREEDRFAAAVSPVDYPVYVSFSQVAANDPRNAVDSAGQGSSGFYVPKGGSLNVNTSSEIWVTATSSSAGRVSFQRDRYSEEQ